MNLLKEIGAQVLHALLAMLTLLPVTLWIAFVNQGHARWAVILTAFVSFMASSYTVGWLREDSQHRAHFDKTPEGWAWWLKSFPIGGRHRDMYAFAVGGAADAALVLFVPWFN